MTSLLGVIIIVGVCIFALSERAQVKISFFDSHALAVVVGGVIGALFVAIDRHALMRMGRNLLGLLPFYAGDANEDITDDIERMRKSWREGRRGEILEYAEASQGDALRTAADCLLQQLSPASISEKFTEIRSTYFKNYAPTIEGWEMVGKLAPSFGMVGTVTGMVLLFRNMADNAGNLGGAMAMALLATLYGITLGAALGGPMATRVQNQLNDRLADLELLEKTIVALLQDSRMSQESRT